MSSTQWNCCFKFSKVRIFIHQNKALCSLPTKLCNGTKREPLSPLIPLPLRGPFLFPFLSFCRSPDGQFFFRSVCFCFSVANNKSGRLSPNRTGPKRTTLRLVRAGGNPRSQEVYFSTEKQENSRGPETVELYKKPAPVKMACRSALDKQNAVDIWLLLFLVGSDPLFHFSTLLSSRAISPPTCSRSRDILLRKFIFF